MNNEGAHQLAPVARQIETAARRAFTTRGQALPCSSSNRLMGPPGMMVEMACL
jgi:hypothetical protein